MQDRGMMKWQPFASLTEQGESIYELINELGKIEKPILDDWQHEENARQLLSAHLAQDTIMITYYRDGYLHDLKGTVIKINEPYRYVLFQYLNARTIKIPFDAIIEVKY